MLKHPVRPMVLIVAIFAFACAQGCESRRATMGSWQKTLSQYSAAQANNDLSFLRGDPGTGGAGGPGTEGGRPQFSIIGAKSADDSTDVTGVLLGRRTLIGRDWFIFILGGIVDRRVEEIRVAILEDAPGKPMWVVGRPDSVSLATYQQHKRTMWQSQNPARPEPPPALMGFPGESDVFELQTAQNTISVVEKTSGARWTLVLPDLKQPASPATPPPATTRPK